MTHEEAIEKLKAFLRDREFYAVRPDIEEVRLAVRALEILKSGLSVVDHETERAYCREQVELRFGSYQHSAEVKDADADWLMELRAEARAEREP